MDSNVLSASLMAGSTAIAVFTSMVPHMAEVHAASESSDTARATRVGEVASAAVIFAVGVMTSVMTHSKLPLLVAVAACLILTGCYETVLRH